MLGQPAYFDLKERGAESWTETEAAAVAAYEVAAAFEESIGDSKADNFRENDATTVILQMADALAAAGITLPAEPLGRIRDVKAKLDALATKAEVLKR